VGADEGDAEEEEEEEEPEAGERDGEWAPPPPAPDGMPVDLRPAPGALRHVPTALGLVLRAQLSNELVLHVGDSALWEASCLAAAGKHAAPTSIRQPSSFKKRGWRAS